MTYIYRRSYICTYRRAYIYNACRIPFSNASLPLDLLCEMTRERTFERVHLLRTCTSVYTATHCNTLQHTAFENMHQCLPFETVDLLRISTSLLSTIWGYTTRMSSFVESLPELTFFENVHLLRIQKQNVYILRSPTSADFWEWPPLENIYTATHCNTLQHTATHCNTLQHTATPCNTLQHTALENIYQCLQVHLLRMSVYLLRITESLRFENMYLLKNLQVYLLRMCSFCEAVPALF